MIYSYKEKFKYHNLPHNFPTSYTRPFILGVLALAMDSQQLTLLSAFSTLCGLGQITYFFWLEIPPGRRGTHYFPQGRSVMNGKEG